MYANALWVVQYMNFDFDFDFDSRTMSLQIIILVQTVKGIEQDGAKFP